MKKHGETKGGFWSDEYKTYHAIIDRCNPNSSKPQKNYAGRGIKVCDRWKDDFLNFLSDMGRKPSKDHSIERIDNNDDYHPSNCKWATRKEQGRNKRTNHIVTHNGTMKCLSDWEDETAIAAATIRARLKYGWSESEAVTTPLNEKRPNVHTCMRPPPKTECGSSNFNSKLTTEEVEKVFVLRSQGMSFAKIGKHFGGMTKTAIRSIIIGTNRKDEHSKYCHHLSQ